MLFCGLGKNIFTFIWWFVNLCLLLGIDNLKRNKMRIENTRDYIKTGEFVCIKNSQNETLVRFYFADYKTDEIALLLRDNFYGFYK